MSKRDPEYHKKILELREKGFTNKEIARKLNRSQSSVSFILSKNYGGNPNYRKKITKHKHLHKNALETFKNNTMFVTAKKLNLSLRELKSCLTYAYKDQKLKHIRKDKRRKDKWSEEEIKIMLQLIGLRPRDVIAETIGRGNARVIKEKLQHLGLKYPKYTNGLTLSRFRSIFHVEPDFVVVTDAGPTRGVSCAPTTFQIVPWVWIKDAIEYGELNPEASIKEWVYSMSDFQEWIHEGKAYENLIETQNDILKNSTDK